MSSRFLSLVLAGAGILVFNAQADPITTLHNTAEGGTNGTFDTNWTIIGPGGTVSTWVTGGYPVGTAAWVADNLPDYGWISPQSNYNGIIPKKDPVGNYSFTTTFNLSGFDSSTAILQFMFAVDDQLTSVVLNSTTFAITGNNVSSLSDLQTINSGFVTGLNTITFNVTNLRSLGANPVGLLVDFTFADAGRPTPEPATFGIVGLGLVGVALLRRRRKTPLEGANRS